MKRPVTTHYKKGRRTLRVGRAGTVQNALVSALKHAATGRIDYAEIVNGHGVVKAEVSATGKHINVWR